MQTFKATRITVVSEKLIQAGITRILDQAGATGYSFFEGGGKGAHGLHPAHRPTIVDDFAIVKIEAIVAGRDVAETIAERISDAYFGTHSAIVYLNQVEILRPAKF